MRTLQNLFIAYLYENMSAVPHEITFRILEDFDNSEALKKLSMEKEAAFSSTKRIHASTIDDAIKAVEDIANSLMDFKLPTEEKEKQKAQNKVIGESVKCAYCEWLQGQSISIV